jgi:hypothetical protein
VWRTLLHTAYIRRTLLRHKVVPYSCESPDHFLNISKTGRAQK